MAIFRKAFLVSYPTPHSLISTSLVSSQGACSLLETSFVDHFDRWRFCQGILEGEAQGDLVNQVLFQVLEGAFQFPRPKSDEAGSPEMTAKLKGKIENCLATATGGRVAAIRNPESNVIELLEELLPDPRNK